MEKEKTRNIMIYEKEQKKYTLIKDFYKLIIKKVEWGGFELYVFTKDVNYMYNLDYYEFCISGDGMND